MRRMAAPFALSLLAGCSSLPLPSISFGGNSPPRRDVEATAPLPPGQPEALYLDMIRGLRERGMHRAAIAHLDEYERRFRRTPGTTLLRGQSLLAIDDDQAALTVFRTITSGPEAAAAKAGIGTVMGRAGQWDRAVEAFTAATQIEPTNARYINNLGYALLRQGNTEQGEFRLRMASELDPSSAEIRNNLALLLLASNRRADGEQLLQQMPDGEARAAIRRAAAQIQSQTATERRS